MANTESLRKIKKFIDKAELPVTFTHIRDSTHITNDSVRDCLKILVELNQIEVISNGRTCLVRVKGEQT